MRTQLTRIGNSRGLRIPKPLIEECGLDEIIELRVTNEGLIISPVRAARQGWGRAFASEVSEREGVMLQTTPTKFDREEWKW